MRQDVYAVVRAMAREDPGPIRDDMSLINDLGFDSLRLIELSVVIEQRFHLPTLDAIAGLSVESVGDLLSLLRQLSTGAAT